MDRKEVMLELYTGSAGGFGAAGGSGADRARAVHRAKREFISTVRRRDYYDPSLEVHGESTIFPVLVVAGPGRAVDAFSDRVMDDLPQMVRGIDRDLHFSAVAEVADTGD